MFFCSCCDHAADCEDAGGGAFRSPIRGCEENASSQSSKGKPFQISSEHRTRDDSFSNGRRAASARAQAREPQQGRISLAACSASSPFQRARTLLMLSLGLPPYASGILLQGFPRRPCDMQRWIEYRLWDEPPRWLPRAHALLSRRLAHSL